MLRSHTYFSRDDLSNTLRTLSLLFNLIMDHDADVADPVESLLKSREDPQSCTAPGPASQAAIESLPTVRPREKLGDCSLCLDRMVRHTKTALLPCNHSFHRRCLTPWLKQVNTCPYCRRRATDEDASIRSRGSQGRIWTEIARKISMASSRVTGTTARWLSCRERFSQGRVRTPVSIAIGGRFARARTMIVTRRGHCNWSRL